MIKRLLGPLTMLGLFAATPLPAEEGRIPIYEPVTLTAGGKYVVTRDITESIGSPIRVAGNGTQVMEIDLNGFTLTSTSFIAIDVIDVKSVVIRNGTAIAPSTTVPAVRVVAAGADGKAVLEDLTIQGGREGISLNPVANFAIRRNFILDSQADGISITNSSFVSQGSIEDNVLRNVATASGTGGISLFGSMPRGVTVRGNTIQSNFTGIQVASGTGFFVADNDITPGGGSGISVLSSETCTVVNNRVNGTGSSFAIQIANTAHCLVADNVASGALFGIALQGATDNRIERNIANANTLDGIVVEDSFGTPSLRNVLKDNVANDNGYHGIHIEATNDDNRYGGNSAVGNVGTDGCGVVTPACPVTVDFCDEGAGNLSFGDNLVPGPPQC